MSRMVNILIDSDDLLDELMNRLYERWDVDPDEITYKLYEEYYREALEGGLFDGAEFNVMEIVDNDYKKWLSVMTDDEVKEDEVDEDDIEVTLTDDDGTVCHLVR